ncbi:SDR family oxidoreductase [Cupriavidus sp. IDO]|uniref:SDR family oxidoreductase n=1 Tax=Cupriavidus sp. IDO TaxID=1539142 RepID=UPI0030836C21
MDISDKQSILAMYKQVGTVEAVVCVGGTAPLDALTDDDFAFSLANKLMGQVNLVRYGVPYISQGGSVTLTSGTLAQHPVLGGAAVSTVNAGIEAFGRAAALELQGKIRVNVVSPGWGGRRSKRWDAAPPRAFGRRWSHRPTRNTLRKTSLGRWCQ